MMLHQGDRVPSMISQSESGYGSDHEDIDFFMPNGMVVPLKCERHMAIGSIKEELWAQATQRPGASLLRNSDHYVFIGVRKDSTEHEFDDSTKVKDLDLVWPLLEVSVPKKDRDNNRLFRIVDCFVDAAVDSDEVVFVYLAQRPLLWEAWMALKPGGSLIQEVLDVQCFLNMSYAITFHAVNNHSDTFVNFVKVLWSEMLRNHYASNTFIKQANGEVCGVTVQSLDTASLKNPELYAHRDYLKKLGTEAAKERLSWSRDEQVQFFYPAILDINPDLPYCTAKLIIKARNNIEITAWLFEDSDEYSFDIVVAATYPPSQVVAKILQKRYEERYQTGAEIDRRVSEYRDHYVLKVCGKEEYMLQECCVHAYKYFRNCINNQKKPQLQIVLKDGLYKCLPNNKCVMLQQEPEPCEESNPPSDAITTWDLSYTDKYSIRINSLPARKHENLRLEYYVEAQITHGKQPLSKPLRTIDRHYNQPMEFDVSIQSLPRCARLCFIICSLERNRPFSEARILGRLNVNIFDVNGVLVTGNFSKGVWEATESSNKYTPGLVDGNPDGQALALVFDIISPASTMVIYPTDREIDEKSAVQHTRSSDYKRSDRFERLDAIAKHHPLEKLVSSEKEFLWQQRDLLPEYNPNMLPWLYHSVNWLERQHVLEFYRLLKLWPKKKVLLPTTLQLIGPDFVDSRTRSFAVECLQHHKTPEQLRLYLPQLIQAYRFDNYMMNTLGYFLVYQAWKDKTLGHDFFWHLRCEMSRAQSKQRFAPLLEVYCLYCGEDILDAREKEVKAMKKYQEVSREIKQEKNADNHIVILQKWLTDEDTKSVLQNKPSTMDENVELGELCVDDCKLLTSKMRPLWLSWKNRSTVPEEMGTSTVKYIVKCGDDLRQDMLVGQLLQLMDMFWKYTDSDYQLTLYNCLALEDEIGLIEVVRDAQTVCDIEIQSEKGLLAGTVSSTHIHEWLTDIVYREKREYLDMVNRFTMSCAGYCVATYLLGVGDRHSDNIMITREGKLFHIDFGHFMNHKKSKAGVNRERNPFVLTNEFVRVINRGASKPDRFNEFVYKCFEAFMVIRRNANVFITLLQIMMHCGIPELTENKDVEYFINSLRLGQPEHIAAEHFISEVFKSVKGQWTVKVDWMFHRLNKSMKARSS